MATKVYDPLASLDYGIDDTDNSITTVQVGDDTVILSTDEMLNPFFVGVTEKKLDALEKKHLFFTCDYVYVLCTKNDYVDNKLALKIYDYMLNKFDYTQLAEYFTLVKCSRNLIRNKLHYNNAVNVNKSLVEQFNHKHYVLETEEIVIPMYELKEQHIPVYNSLYDTHSSYTNLKELLALSSAYTKNCHGIVSKHLSNNINNMKESDYWTIPFNCNFNMSESFDSRKFQYREILNTNIKASIVAKSKLSQDTDVIKIIDKLENLKPKPSYEMSPNKKESYTDVLNALKQSAKRTYFATIDTNTMIFTKDSVTELFNQITDERELFDVFNAFLVSKEYCHMVINNSIVLTKMQSIFEKYAPLYKYLFGYPWISLYTEECIFKTKAKISSRYVFDVNTASKLPVFPYSPEDLHQNPYLALLVSDKLLSSKHNCLSLPMIQNYNGYGIATLTEFQQRFNIFTTGDVNKNILDGIDWSSFGVSGSVIPACLQKRPILLDLVSTDTQTETNKWLNYFSHYYNESDIDLMCNKKSIFEFMDAIADVANTVKKNLTTEKEPAVVEIEPIKSMIMIVSGHYLSERLEHIQEYTGTNWTLEETIKNINTYVMKEYFYHLYCDIKLESNKTYRKLHPVEKNMLYNEYYKLSSIDDMNITLVTYEIEKMKTTEHDCEVSYYVNDYRTKENAVPSNKNYMVLKMSENIKFKLRSKKMLHCIEAFRSKEKDFFSVVARFHLPCVRAYYAGTNLYMLPSCITALMTGINIDYKYFAGIRDPIDILNKYRMRGFGTILNSNEKQHMIYYNSNVDKSGGMFKVDPKHASMFFGPRKLTDDIFKPRTFIDKLPADIYHAKPYAYINSQQDVIDQYKTKYKYDSVNSGINMFKFTTINKDGYIEPLKKWIMNAYYEIVNSKQ